MKDDDQFDVVVVGAGPAGCVLARRLTEDPGRTVVLLGAGPDYGPDPATWPEDLRYPDEIFIDILLHRQRVGQLRSQSPVCSCRQSESSWVLGR